MKPTNVLDINGKMIYTGDVLKDDGSLYFVCEESGHIYLSLLCGIDDSCRDIPYSFNKENEYEVVYSEHDKTDNTKTVIIHVRGGCADVYKQPDDVTVAIVDWDNLEDGVYWCPCCGEDVSFVDIDDARDFVCPYCDFDISA